MRKTRDAEEDKQIYEHIRSIVNWRNKYQAGTYAAPNVVYALYWRSPLWSNDANWTCKNAKM